ncbi:hypothetical protein [Methylocapsa sp. S129]|uniref:hypothetical protein n=1 Tax=Methylocapsa sp. S129 TaxID=1641869 RepID=UPI00131DB693|nr:hypothetical protein [Methylocapsa sp. S129]
MEGEPALAAIVSAIALAIRLWLLVAPGAVVSICGRMFETVAEGSLGDASTGFGGATRLGAAGADKFKISESSRIVRSITVSARNSGDSFKRIRSWSPSALREDNVSCVMLYQPFPRMPHPLIESQAGAKLENGREAGVDPLNIPKTAAS